MAAKKIQHNTSIRIWQVYDSMVDPISTTATKKWPFFMLLPSVGDIPRAYETSPGNDQTFL